MRTDREQLEALLGPGAGALLEETAEPPIRVHVHPRHPPRYRRAIHRMCVLMLLCAITVLVRHSAAAQPENRADAAVRQTSPAEAEAPEEPVTHTAVFWAAGETVAEVSYVDGAETVDEPDVPAVAGYTGTWADYVLDGDVTVEAVYTYDIWTGAAFGENLSVYAAPADTGDPVGTLRLGETVTVIGTETVGEAVWYETSAGWIPADCVLDGDAPGEEIAAALGIEWTGDWALSAATAAALADAIRAVTDAGDTVSFQLVDLERGAVLSYRADTTYYCASTIKGPYVCSILSQYPAAAETDGETMRAVLVHSSNEGYASLRSRYGVSCLDRWCDMAGVTLDTSKKWPPITAEILCSLWIQNEAFFAASTVGAAVGSWFEAPEVSAIQTALGDRSLTRSKAGWISDESAYYQASHDAGLVYADNGTYAVAILSSVPADLTAIEPLAAALDLAHDDLN